MQKNLEHIALDALHYFGPLVDVTYGITQGFSDHVSLLALPKPAFYAYMGTRLAMHAGIYSLAKNPEIRRIDGLQNGCMSALCLVGGYTAGTLLAKFLTHP
ncbi:MAG: hypothetical protein ACMXYC_03280 [Candidatus Woesearchaeota archaeon]